MNVTPVWCQIPGQPRTSLLPSGAGAWPLAQGAAGPPQRGRGVGEVSVCGVNGGVCMRTCWQASAGMGGQERSVQDPSCQASFQNLPCFSLSMW